MWGWALAGLLGLVSLSLPRFLNIDSDRAAKFIISEAALFISGALVGALRPDRAWRWPIASLLSFFGADVLRLSADPRHYGFNLSGIMSMMLDNSFTYFVSTLPVLLGAYAGSVMIKEGLD